MRPAAGSAEIGCARDADGHAFGAAAKVAREVRAIEAVGCEHLHAGGQPGAKGLEQTGAPSTRYPPRNTPLAPGASDSADQWPVAAAIGLVIGPVGLGGARTTPAIRGPASRRVAEARGHAAAVECGVVEDEHAVGAQRPGQHGVGCALDVVGGYDPREVPPTGGVVAAGFARGGARSGVCQSDRGGRGGDHRERSMGGAVGDRDLDRRAVGEERADDRDHARVVGERPRIGCAARPRSAVRAGRRASRHRPGSRA